MVGDTTIEGKDFSNEIYSISIGNDKGLSLFRLCVSLYLFLLGTALFIYYNFVWYNNKLESAPGKYKWFSLAYLYLLFQNSIFQVVRSDDFCHQSLLKGLEIARKLR